VLEDVRIDYALYKERSFAARNAFLCFLSRHL